MEKKAALEASLVQEFVAKAHGDLGRVKELLEREPRLVNAVWDWGGGDFESALGAASHVGRKDIATFLLGHGARLDIFAAAMLASSTSSRRRCRPSPRQRMHLVHTASRSSFMRKWAVKRRGRCSSSCRGCHEWPGQRS
jgi:hypothetical protein